MVTQGSHGTALDSRRYVSRSHLPYISYSERRLNQLGSSPLSVLTSPTHHHSPYGHHGYHHHDIRAAAQAATLFTVSSMPESVLEESAPPRKRIAVACQRCRKRKIRCSGDPGNGQPCSNCKNAGTEPCLFLRVSSQEAPFRDTGIFNSYSLASDPPPSTSRTTYPGARTAGSPLGAYAAADLTLGSTAGAGDMLAGYRSSHALSPASDHHALVAKSAAAYYSPWSPTSAASSTGHYGAVGAGEPTNADGSATIEYSSLTCTNPAAVMGYDSTVSVHLVPYPAGAGATDGYGGYPTVSSAALVRSSMTSAGPTTPPSPYSGFRGLGGLASALPSSADRSGQSGSAAAGTSPIVGRNPLPSASGQNRPATAHDLGGNSGHYSASSYDAYHHHPGHHQQHHHTASHSGSHHRGSAETAYATAAPDPAYDYKPRVSESLSPGGGANSSNCGGGSAATTGELPNGRQYHVAHAAGEQPHSYVTSCGVRPADDARNASAAHHGSGSAAGTLVKST